MPNHFPQRNFKPEITIEDLKHFYSQRLFGIIHVKEFSGKKQARFVSNSLIGSRFYNTNLLEHPTLLKEGANLSSNTIDEFIEELKELKEVLQSIEIAETLSQD